jgi:hypothetical protein
MDKLRPIAEKHNVTLLQLACLWNLAQPAVHCVVPTLIQEAGPESRSIEGKADELAALPQIKLLEDDCEWIARVGDNQGCMALKGANQTHTGTPEPDRWGLTADLESIGRQWRIKPEDLALTHSEPAR